MPGQPAKMPAKQNAVALRSARAKSENVPPAERRIKQRRAKKLLCCRWQAAACFEAQRKCPCGFRDDIPAHQKIRALHVCVFVAWGEHYNLGRPSSYLTCFLAENMKPNYTEGATAGRAPKPPCLRSPIVFFPLIIAALIQSRLTRWRIFVLAQRSWSRRTRKRRVRFIRLCSGNSAGSCSGHVCLLARKAVAG